MTPISTGRPGTLLCCVFVLIVLCSGTRGAAAEKETWVLIDTGDRRLSVMQGDVVRQTYDNISIGRGGTTLEKRQRDGTTPLGEFHIVRVTTDTPFHRFFALDYPDVERAGRALQAGIINQDQYAAIRRAGRKRQVPPQDTVLGGYIGIHGVGQGNPAIHRDFNWTYGCIALTNAQIDDLSRRVQPGTRVIIQR